MSDDGKKRGLGRGLSALFGEETAISEPQRTLRTVPVELLHPGRYQPRRSFDEASLAALVDSILAQGVLQPLLVRKDPDKPGSFEILAGERRWRAAQRAKLHDVPVVVRDVTDREALEFALVENIQRSDLTPLEEAAGYQRLIDEFGHTQEVLAQALGKSRSHIANTLRLLGLPGEVKAMLDEGSLTAGHARALLGASDPVRLAKEVARAGLNVRQTEALVKADQRPPSTAAPHADRNADIVALEKELADILGLKVSLSFDGKGGKLSIHYGDLDQLDDVLRRLRR